MPFVVAEFDPGEISFFHHDRAFRRYDPPQTHTTSVHPGLVAKHGVRLHFLHGGSGVVELGRLLAPRRMSPSGLRLMLGSIC